MNINAIEVTIGKVECKPGDVLVVSTERTLSDVQVHHIRGQLDAVMPDGVRALVMHGGLKLNVLTNPIPMPSPRS